MEAANVRPILSWRANEGSGSLFLARRGDVPLDAWWMTSSVGLKVGPGGELLKSLFPVVRRRAIQATVMEYRESYAREHCLPSSRRGSRVRSGPWITRGPDRSPIAVRDLASGQVLGASINSAFCPAGPVFWLS